MKAADSRELARVPTSRSHRPLLATDAHLFVSALLSPLSGSRGAILVVSLLLLLPNSFCLSLCLSWCASCKRRQAGNQLVASGYQLARCYKQQQQQQRQQPAQLALQSPSCSRSSGIFVLRRRPLPLPAECFRHTRCMWPCNLRSTRDNCQQSYSRTVEQR